MKYAGWFFESQIHKKKTTEGKSNTITKDGNFDVFIPLKLSPRVFVDCREVVVKVQQKLFLVRSNKYEETVISTDETKELKIEVIKPTWRF